MQRNSAERTKEFAFGATEDLLKWKKTRVYVEKNKPHAAPLQKFASTELMLKGEAETAWKVKREIATSQSTPAEPPQLNDDSARIAAPRGATEEA